MRSAVPVRMEGERSRPSLRRPKTPTRTSGHRPCRPRPSRSSTMAAERLPPGPGSFESERHLGVMPADDRRQACRRTATPPWTSSARSVPELVGSVPGAIEARAAAPSRRSRVCLQATRLVGTPRTRFHAPYRRGPRLSGQRRVVQYLGELREPAPPEVSAHSLADGEDRGLRADKLQLLLQELIPAVVSFCATRRSHALSALRLSRSR
jgi:hypothetical protein